MSSLVSPELPGLIAQIEPSVVPIGYACVLSKITDKAVIQPVQQVVGSGFVVTHDGLVATCAHVIQGIPPYADVIVGFAKAERMVGWHFADVVVCAGDEVANLPALQFPDVCLLRIRQKVLGSKKAVDGDGKSVRLEVLMVDPPKSEEATFKALKLGSAKDLMVGDEVVFLGYPSGGGAGQPLQPALPWLPTTAATFTSLGFKPSAVRAMVSAIRKGHALQPLADGKSTFSVIELDSACNGGNSGGPVILTRSGEVVGFVAFNTPALSASTFAYEADLIAMALQQFT